MKAYQEILKKNYLKTNSKGDLSVFTPIDGKEIARVKCHSVKEATKVVGKSVKAFEQWRSVPAPVRGELIRRLGEELRKAKNDLGALVTLESAVKFSPKGRVKCRR